MLVFFFDKLDSTGRAANCFSEFGLCGDIGTDVLRTDAS